MNNRKASCWTAAIGCALLFVVSELPAQEHTTYALLKVLDVAGRQGVATDGKHYFVSGSTQLYTYSKDGTLMMSNEQPFADLEKPANHLSRQCLAARCRYESHRGVRDS